jgi:hypothetical protein
VRQYGAAPDLEDEVYDRLFSYLIQDEENEDVSAVDLSDVAVEALQRATRDFRDERLAVIYG